jgi:hypothetical protein
MNTCASNGNTNLDTCITPVVGSFVSVDARSRYITPILLYPCSRFSLANSPLGTPTSLEPPLHIVSQNNTRFSSRTVAHQELQHCSPSTPLFGSFGSTPTRALQRIAVCPRVTRLRLPVDNPST